MKKDRESIIRNVVKGSLIEESDMSPELVQLAILEVLIDIRNILYTKANEGITHVYPEI